jgi:hypothetical protein
VLSTRESSRLASSRESSINFVILVVSLMLCTSIPDERMAITPQQNDGGQHGQESEEGKES